MPVIPLPGTRRDAIGKGAARKARAAGRIPGVLYGHGEQPVALTISAREFELAVRKQGGNPIIGLGLDGGEHTALIRDVQYDPISHDIIHLDFLRISLTETIEVEVPVHLVGESAAVKRGDADVLQPLHALRVECLPSDIPEAFEVDLTPLEEVESELRVSDLKVPTDVTLLEDAEELVVKIVHKREMKVEEEVPAPEAAVPTVGEAGAEGEAAAAAETETEE